MGIIYHKVTSVPFHEVKYPEQQKKRPYEYKISTWPFTYRML